MVGEKYSRLASLVRLSPFCPYSSPAVLLKSERSSILWRRIRRISPHAQGPSCSKAEVLAVPWPPIQPPISSSGLTYLSINQTQKQKLTELLQLKFYPAAGTQFISNNLALQISSYPTQKPLNSQHSACITTNITN